MDEQDRKNISETGVASDAVGWAGMHDTQTPGRNVCFSAVREP